VVAKEPLLRIDDDEDAVAVIYERQGIDPTLVSAGE
jgi:hypothetical protein